MPDKRKIVEEYCYPKACGFTYNWPEKMDAISDEQKERIDVVCDDLLEVKIPRPVTVSSLASSPGSYVPMLRYLMTDYESEYDQELLRQQESTLGKAIEGNVEGAVAKEAKNASDLPRLFALTPEPSSKFRFITINSTGLKAFTTSFKKVPSTFTDNQNMFFRVFDFSKLKLKRYCQKQ
jgi:hypothetical protein